MRRLIWLAEVPFVGLPHRQVHLSTALSQWFEVLYVEPPPPRRLAHARVQRVHGVHVAQAVPWLNARPAPLRRALSWATIRRLASGLGLLQVRLAMRRAGWSSRDRELIVISSNVFLSHAFSRLTAQQRVLDICDDPRFYPGEPPWTADLLRASLSVADLTVTSSLALREEFASLGARQVRYLPNGIAPELLFRAPEGMARGHRARPTIGFLGYLGPWLDFDLLRDLAQQLPEADLVLVGPVDVDRHDQVAALQELSNVRFAGPVAYDGVAGAIAAFDVGLIPFQVIPYTRAVNPLKLYEYAAQDVPIVTTAFSPDVEQFGEAVHVARDPSAFVDAVRAVLRAGQQRPSIRWIAEQHTWPRLAARYAALLGVAEAGDSDARALS